MNKVLSPQDINQGQTNSNTPKAVGEIIDDMLQSNSLFARGYRQHQSVYPNTEPCIDLKLLTREPGRIPIGNYLDGAITRDADDHFLFIENATDKKRNDAQQRNHTYTRVYTSTSSASPTERSSQPSTDRSSTKSSHS